jgi:hypothetical protein
MRTRIIITAIVVTGLFLGVGGYIKAQLALAEDLPNFTAGQVLTAEELNTLVDELKTQQQINQDLVTWGYDLEGRLACNTEGSCNSDSDLSDECQEFVNSCMTTEDPAGCIGGGVFICEEEELPDGVDQDNVCNEDFCLVSETQRRRCELFMDSCLLSINIEERCVAGGLFICTNPIINKIGL